MVKKILLGLIIACGVVTMALPFSNQKVEAAGYCSTGLPRINLNGCQGYFTGRYASAAFGTVGNVLTNGLYVNSADAMISQLRGQLNGSNVRNQRGAAFIIDMMLGHGRFSTFSGGISYAKNNFGDWAQLVRNYDSAPASASYGVKWNVTICPGRNSAYFADIGDEAFHDNRDGCLAGIDFHDGSKHFQIERRCGNLVGAADVLGPHDNNPPQGSIISVACDATTGRNDVTVKFRDADGRTRARVVVAGGAGGLTKYTDTSPGTAYFTAIVHFYVSGGLDPYNQQRIRLQVKDIGGGGDYTTVDTAQTKICADVKCATSSVSPDSIDPKTPFQITVSVRTTVSAMPSGTNTMKLWITPVAPATWTPSTNPRVTTSVSYSNKMISHTFSFGSTNEVGNYIYKWAYTNSDDASLNVSGCGGTVDTEVQVGAMPYLSVYGGDALAGAYASDADPNCQEVANAGFVTWNNDGSSDYAGAGVQMAAIALGQIRHFASGLGGSDPLKLSFADTSDVASGTTYGGQFGEPGSGCDFIGDTTGAQTSLPSNTWTGTAGLVGKKTIYIKNQNVYISGNTIYSGTASWTQPTDIPSFKLVVVGGDIYIQNTVSELDGLYIAEPTTDDATGNTTGGNIYTCATWNGSAPVEKAQTDPDYDAFCNHKLTVYGSFVAMNIRFHRTYGTLGGAKTTDGYNSNNAAETFVYTPEMWLPNTAEQGTVKYDSILGLPPVL